MSGDQEDLLRRAIRESPGWEIRRELRAVARSYRVFLGNDRELLGYLAAHEELPRALELWNADNRDGFERFLDEVDRLLHNYLASVATLRDHTRRLWKKYPPDSADPQGVYDEQRRAAFDAPVCAFVQNLRNAAAHHRLPVAYGHLSAKVGISFEAYVVVAKASLLEWDGWSASAGEYLTQAPDEIRLADPIGAYTRAVAGFNKWFGRAFAGAHLEALEDVARHERELAAFYRGMGADDEAPPG
jgi:hypothetical protein